MVVPSVCREGRGRGYVCGGVGGIQASPAWNQPPWAAPPSPAYSVAARGLCRAVFHCVSSLRALIFPLTLLTPARHSVNDPRQVVMDPPADQNLHLPKFSRNNFLTEVAQTLMAVGPIIGFLFLGQTAPNHQIQSGSHMGNPNCDSIAKNIVAIIFPLKSQIPKV